MATDEVIQQRLGEAPEDEAVKERLEREHSELLEELRALIPGAQVLFGFLLAIRFTSPFSDLTAVQRYPCRAAPRTDNGAARRRPESRRR